jgi:outer membrane receptor protein involved in Fe transport
MACYIKYHDQLMKFFLSLFTGMLFSTGIFAQVGEEPVRRENNGRQQNTGRLYGKIVDAKTNRGIEAASVQLFRKSDHSLAGGMLTKPNGDFDVPNISITDTFLLEVTAIGFTSQEITVFFDNAREKDLGNIRMATDSKLLGTVTVVGQRPALVMGIDRKAFDVSKSIVSTGGTAVDVMRNIPSVTVDVDGNVLLRNTSPQIFVDGRPTILTLEQIPADHIERVELITNPSSKFDAASVGGIINVVLKKDKKLGLNGQVSAGIGTPGVYTGNVTFNLREGQFNYFLSGNYNERGGKTRGETFRQNKDKGSVTDYFNQYSLNERLRRFGSVRFGIDYFLDNRNTLTLTQNFVKGRNGNNEEQNQEYLDIDRQLNHTGLRTSIGKFGFNRSNTRLSYRRTFVETGKTFDADISYNTGSGSDNTDINNEYFYPDGSIYAPTNIVRNNGSNKNNQMTIQVDFVDPKGEDGKLETGLRTYINDFTSLFDAYSLSNGGEVKLPLSNNYKYLEMVNAAYLTYTGKLWGIRYQAGLRAEHSKFTGELVDSAFKFGYQYPAKLDNLFDALFPSLYLTKEVGEGQEVQLNYSRRIRRPNFWNLNPFVDINDPLNIRQGNPALKPEFTNKFEFNYDISYETGNFLGVLYFNNTTGEITRYSDTLTAAQYQQLNNAAVDPSAILNTYINADVENRLGAELTLQQKITDNFDITPTIDMQYTKISVKNDKLDLSNEGFTFETKLIANYRVNSRSPLLNKLSFQVSGEYEAPEVEPQGKNKEQYVVDAGFRKDFLKNNKATLTFNIHDVFNTRRYGSIYDTENFYQDSYRRWSVRSFRVTLSYRFGDANFSLFKRNNNRDDNNDRGEDRVEPNDRIQNQ